MHVCDEDFPGSSASNTTVSADPDYALMQYLAQLESPKSPGLTVSGITVERLGTKLELGPGTKETEKIHGGIRGLQATSVATLIVQHDGSPWETAWSFKGYSTTQGGLHLGKQRENSVYTPGWKYTNSFPIPSGVFEFIITDSYGDGLSDTSYGYGYELAEKGYWALAVNGYLVAYSYFKKGKLEGVRFSLG
jgi:hypothetical protein